MLQRLLWKLLPKEQRQFLLNLLPAEQRQLVNKVMSDRARFPSYFRERRCLFIHVPKCAGSSIRTALFDGQRPGHLPLYWYEQQFPREYTESFKFAFVRDPLERAYSAYTYLSHRGVASRDHSARLLVERYTSFDEFVSHWLHPENLHKQLHFVPQSTFLCDAMGHLAMDFIGRQERLAEDFQKLCQIMSWQVELPHRNVSRKSSSPAHECCSSRTRRLVRRAYQRDYQMLGYD